MRSWVPAGEINPDEAIVAADSLSQQALEAQAEDLAIEDTLYALELALTKGVLTAYTHLDAREREVDSRVWVLLQSVKDTAGACDLKRPAVPT